MDLNAFRQFVESNVKWFRGGSAETQAALLQYETDLRCILPTSMKWLLATHGYWHATGIPNLAKSVALTLDLRKSINLPQHLVILNDLGDGGVIVLDASSRTIDDECRIYNVDSTALHNIDSVQIELDIVYDSYGHYVESVLETERDIIDTTDIVYDP